MARPKPTALGLHCFNASIAGCRWKPYRIGKKCLWRYFFDDRREHRGRGGAGTFARDTAGAALGDLGAESGRAGHRGNDVELQVTGATAEQGGAVRRSFFPLLEVRPQPNMPAASMKIAPATNFPLMRLY